MDFLPVDNWSTQSGISGSIENTWEDRDLQVLDWEETYMIDEVPAHDSWDTFATRQKIELEELFKSWGVSKQGTRHYMSIRPRLNANLTKILDNFNLFDHNYNFLKLTPGNQILWHFDTFATFVKFNQIDQTDIDRVYRTAIMMTSWDKGQVLQIGNDVYTHWNAGDCFTWKGYTWHGAANFGPSDMIIAQITFLKDE